MRRPEVSVLVVLLLSTAGAVRAQEAEPGWIEGWVKAGPIGDREEEGHRAEFVRRDSVPASWRDKDTRPQTILVIDAATKKPVGGAFVSSWQTRQWAFTKADGTVGPIAWHEGGAHVVKISAAGYRTGAVSKAARDAQGNVRIALWPDDRLRVTGVVTDPAGMPAADCGVTVRFAGDSDEERQQRRFAQRSNVTVDGVVWHAAQGSSEQVATSDKEGRFALKIDRGRGKASLLAARVGIGAATVELGPKLEGLQVKLDAKAGRVVAGTVVDERGKPVEGVELECKGWKARTGKDGAFKAIGCLPGLYGIQLTGPEGRGGDIAPIQEGSYQGQDQGALRIQIDLSVVDPRYERRRARERARERELEELEELEKKLEEGAEGR